MSKAKYFSHDSDMRNDIKIKALRRKFGHKGYAAWCFFLETLTDSDGFEVDYNEITQNLLAADFELSTEEFAKIVEYSTQIGLLTISDGRLYCKTLNKRFEEINQKQAAISSARRDAINKRWGARNTNVIQTDTKHTKRKEIKEKEINIVYPYQDICELWNSVCVQMPKVEYLSGKRKDKIKARLVESKAKTTEEMISWADTLFRRCAQSDFLCGGSGWKATFDWVFVNQTNWVKVMEGNYDNRKTTINGNDKEHSKEERRQAFAEHIESEIASSSEVS